MVISNTKTNLTDYWVYIFVWKHQIFVRKNILVWIYKKNENRCSHLWSTIKHKKFNNRNSIFLSSFMFRNNNPWRSRLGQHWQRDSASLPGQCLFFFLESQWFVLQSRFSVRLTVIRNFHRKTVLQKLFKAHFRSFIALYKYNIPLRRWLERFEHW